MKKSLSIIIGICLIGFIGWELMDTFKDSKEREVTRSMQATDFTLPTLDGGKKSLQSEKGKIVILNFWASWCKPCKIEMPHFQMFYEEYNADIEILAVNVTSKDKLANVQSFVAENALTFPILLDESGEISTMFGAFSLPATIIIDRQGNIVREILGPMDEKLLLEFIAPLL